MDKQERKQIQKLADLLASIREEHGDVPIQMLETLLRIALNEGCSQQEVMKLTKQSKAANARNISMWTNWTRHKKIGPGLVESTPDPMELRRRIVRLTRSGQRYITELANALA